MHFKIYESYKENKKNSPLFETAESFVSLEDKNIKQITDALRKGGITIFVDDTKYDKTISVTQINIKDVGKLYFVFATANDKEEIIKSISSLKELPVETDEDKINKVKAVIDTIKPFNPLMAISDTYFSFIDEQTFDCLTLMKKEVVEQPQIEEVQPVREEPQTEMVNSPVEPAPVIEAPIAEEAEIEIKPEPKKEATYCIKPETNKMDKEKKKFLLDIFYVSLIPALMTAFLFIGISFFHKDNVGMGIFLIIISLGVSAMFGHGLYLINGEKRNNSPFNRYKLILYAVNLGGLLVGFLFSILLGNTVLETGTSSVVLSLSFIALEIAFIVCIILHISMLLLNEFFAKRKENKRLRK